jgi:hypothetical protein
MRALCATWLLILLWLIPIGCASQPGPDAASWISDGEVCRCVPTTRILGRTSAGTGIPLGGHLLLTARHVVKDRYLQIDGRWARYRVLARGEGPNDDWILIRSNAAPKEATIDLAPGYRLQPGEPIYFLGYWQGTTEEAVDINEARRRPLCVVRAAAARPPVSFSLPTSGLLFAAAPLKGTSYQGISGGPVAVYDAEERRFRIIGIYKGSWEVSALGMSRTLHTVVPIPPEVVEAAAPAR